MTLTENTAPSTQGAPASDLNRLWGGLHDRSGLPDTENWHTRLRAGFDLETTGKDPKTARIVTASLVIVDGNDATVVDHYEWLVNPGIEIPAEAAAVHGVTTERAQADGMDPSEALQQILIALDELMTAGVPVVAFNAPYDFTVLDREAERHEMTELDPTLVFDPYVMDKAVDRYRKGGRTLVDVSRHYGVELLNAHTSQADALAAVMVAGAIATRYPFWAKAPASLQEVQVAYKAQQSASFQDYLRNKKGQLDAVIDGSWPVQPRD